MSALQTNWLEMKLKEIRWLERKLRCKTVQGPPSCVAVTVSVVK